jgi:hypothetical protein
MKDDELERVLAGLDSAIAVFRRNEGKLKVTDIRIQSILATVRQELALYRAVARTVKRTTIEPRQN